MSKFAALALVAALALSTAACTGPGYTSLGGTQISSNAPDQTLLRVHHGSATDWEHEEGHHW